MIGAAGGVVSMVHVNVAADASVFPAASVARTSKVCGPSARLEYEEPVSGHGAKLPVSSLQSKVDPDSLEWKVKSAEAELDGLGGVISIVVSGGVVSMTYVVSAQSEALPSGSVLFALNGVVDPSVSVAVVC